MNASDYNYKNFRVKYYKFDKFDGPKPRETAVDFTAYNLKGEKVKLSDYKGKTIVLETGSITCPIYVNNIKSMNNMIDQFPEVTFLLLYVREAHPGNKIKLHESLDQKITLANQLIEVEDERRTILVDDLQGTGHNLYTAFPNFIYIINNEFEIVNKMEWNDPEAVVEVLKGLEVGKELNPKTKARIANPFLTFKVLRRGGLIAIFDFLPRLPKLILGRIKLMRKQKKALA